MLDKSLPYAGVIMTKRDAGVYPAYSLPQGYTLGFYTPGAERDWAEIMASVGEADSVGAGIELFSQTFGGWPELFGRRNLFAVAPDGTAAATASLWLGETFGVPLPRVHWVACKPEYQGKGLAKALLSALLSLHRELALGDFIYLTTQTWSYKAIGIYRKFGFEPYMGAKPANWGDAQYDGLVGFAGSFDEVNTAAWRLINAKLAERV